ncbi:ABC transporter permease [Deinococcus hopiensis]|uniref:Nucleoside ABC transporter membrane protein n=1 Tax=Deinococcus hopiensis KR-140 TaxID=695939 RepID=A0A1W1VML2_9DEIO|nr:ABC transporter permease [Deinococcus hopiensis]SMB94523.1 nucleoside ABC transporter membrane protein [Deinococcus hopiensis KR-140]
MRFTPVATPSPARATLVTLAAVAFALIVCALIFLAYGVSPAEVYGTMLRGTLADPVGLAEVARRTIPLLLIGSGLALAFRAQFFNIGAEGQLLLGAVFAAGVALFLPLPGAVLLPVMFLAGALGGGLWALIAAGLRRLNVNEILSTLMLNYIAVAVVTYLIAGPWKGKNVQGYIYSDTFREVAFLPTLPGTQVHWPTLALGVVVALGLQWVLTRSTFGYALRVVGENPGAARYAGLSAARVATTVALITGGVAGLAGAGEVAGIHHRLLEAGQISLGYGFTAVIVAWLARGNPALCLLTAPLMGIILAGGDLLKIDLNMPFRVVDVFSGVILLSLIGSEIFVRHRVRLDRP